MSKDDGVAIAKVEIEKGTVVAHKKVRIPILDTIPVAHRFSLTDIEKGALLTQYGYPYGISKSIKVGELISKDNVETYREDYESRVEQILQTRERKLKNRQGNRYSSRNFMGYKRGDGLVGVRNYYIVTPTSLCASDVALKIAQRLEGDKRLLEKYANVDGIVAAAHTEGCGCNDGDIIDRLLLTIRNTIAHPNVGGALIVDLGCEKTNRSVVQKYLGNLSEYDKPIVFISIIELGGTGNTIETGKNIALRQMEKVNTVKREELPIKHLVVGTKCGASDSFSGITANPLIGCVLDKIISGGGSGILTETPEMVGAEASLIKKMMSRAVIDRFIKGMNYYKGIACKLNISMEGNLVPGNEMGGLVNPTLKSLGAILKGGNSDIVDFLDYAERIKHQGLNIMNGPGNDLEAMTGMVASGATIILFSTGMGTTEGSLIVPVIKIPSTSRVFHRMKEDMDFNAGRLIDESISLDELGDELLDLVIEVASGKRTHAEKWGKRSFQIWTAGKLSL
jgi:altronate hydrolase